MGFYSCTAIMTLLTNSLQAVKTRMQLAAARSGRPADANQLLAVSKTFPADAVRGLAQQGVAAFGENYVQEALEKMDALPDLALDWHFIGPIQSNKTRLIATRFTWMQRRGFGIFARLAAEKPPCRAIWTKQ